MRPSAHAVFVSLASLAVGAAVVAGIWVVGGPGPARLRKFDEVRVQNLQSLSAAIDARYSARGELPAGLPALAAEANDLPPAALQDPATSEAYEYRRTGAAEYELCASFSAASDAQTPIRWRHGPGRSCFAFTAPRTKPAP